uniref:Uncharacterized protein n=1 Tax=Corethron hystrix TaxID=216773 RepID=A0A7S1FNN0_9STRA
MAKPLMRTKFYCNVNATNATVLKDPDGNGDEVPQECFDMYDHPLPESNPDNKTLTCGYVGHEQQYQATQCNDGDEEVAVDDTLRKMYLVTNAEVIARIMTVVRHQTQVVMLLTKCLGRLMTFSEAWDDERVMNLADLPATTNATDAGMTVKNLRWKLLYGDTYAAANAAPASFPTSITRDIVLHHRMMLSITSYVNGFFIPCINEMEINRYDNRGGNMQVAHWTTMTACNKVMCTLPGTVWNGSDCEMASTDFITAKAYVEQYCPVELQAWTETNTMAKRYRDFAE